LTLVVILGGCTSGRTEKALQQIGAWDIANYGAYLAADIEAEELEFTIPQINVPITAKNLNIELLLRVGKYSECGCDDGIIEE
jgi:hypothetical protein